MHIFKPLSATLLAATLGLAASCGHATGGQPDSPAGIALQQHFTLNEDLLARYQAAHADVHANPCTAVPAPDMHALQQGKAPSFDGLAARYDTQPAMHAILMRHGLTAKQYLLTQAVLAAARLKYGHQMMEKMDPRTASSIQSPTAAISSGNYSFYLAHRNQIQQAVLQEMHSQSTVEASRNMNCMVNKLQGK